MLRFDATLIGFLVAYFTLEFITKGTISQECFYFATGASCIYMAFSHLKNISESLSVIAEKNGQEDYNDPRNLDHTKRKI
jgi:hypothetical protein